MRKMYTRVKQAFGMVFCLLFAVACDKTESGVPDSGRTVLVYMAGDNNLSSYIDDNIALMKKGMAGVNGRVLIYADPANDAPCLLAIRGAKAGIGYLEGFPGGKFRGSGSPPAAA